MRRRTSALVGVVTLGMIAPVSVVSAQTPGDAEPEKADLEEEVAASTTGSYIVVMREDPLVAGIPQDDLDSPEAKAAGAALVAEQDEVLDEAGIDAGDKVQEYTNALNGFSALLSHDEAVRLAANPKVARVVPDELRQLETDASPGYLGLTVRGGAWHTGLTGEGVVVGVIDSGIWPEHPSFADDGTYPPASVELDDSVGPTCDFGNTAHNALDVPFTCNNKLIGARQMLDTYRALTGAEPDEFDSARDDDGHGTHTASTAAGNYGVQASVYGNELGTIGGVAPRAQIIAYKGLGNLGGYGSDLAAAIDQAVADGVDVINYSVGGGPGLDGGDSIAFLFAARAGVFVATSAGNTGDAPYTLSGPGDAPWITTVGANTQDRFFSGTAVLSNASDPAATGVRATFGHGWIGWFQWWKHWWQQWKDRDVVRLTGASITTGTNGTVPLVDAEDAGNDLCLRGELDPAIVTGAVVLCRRGAIGRAEKSLAVQEAGGAGMILYNNSDTDNLFTDNHWVASIHVDHTEGVEVKAYIDEHPNPEVKLTDTARRTKIDYDPSITIFSSRGPNPSTEDVIKPDLTAPGLQIVAGNSPYPDPDSTPPGELFQAIGGTSMSSPHVAGLFALLKQAHPDWSAAAARSALMTTANPLVRDNDRTSLADPFDTGSGLVVPGKPAAAGSSFNPGLVYEAGYLDYLGLLCGVGSDLLSESTCAQLVDLGIPLDPSDLNYPSIAVAELAGAQTVTRTVTGVADRSVWWYPKVQAPPGYDVTVTPKLLKLAPGESATYEVTFVNDGSGPIGEWRFGSLEWKGQGGHSARSPLAVRGAAFNAPAEISGSGTDGTASFDVSFGYDGGYRAAAHGLEPVTLRDGDISQDPDQTYPSADDGEGVDRIPLALSGAAFLRLELEIPGPDDIDLFLEDSSGTIVAQSTAAGTNELIELTFPADDDYTLVVHGWAVPSEPLSYAISQWVVSATPGGSLSIDSAPTAAATGATGTIDISWSGLDAGVPYLGAVSHSDDTGALGLTLIDVQT